MASPVEDVLSLRASEGCVAIQTSLVERLKGLDVDELLITTQSFNISTMFTGLLRRYAPRNDDSARSAQEIREAKGVKREATNNVNEPLTPHTSPLTNVAFTMAEILLSLTIIGVVAAITLPSLTGNINERTWNTQRKALFSRMNQAVALMPTMNGYGRNDDADIVINNASEVFVTNGLSKVLKMNNICASGSVFDCGLPDKIVNAAGTKIDLPRTVEALNGGIPGTIPDSTLSVINTKASAFETANGESILTFYNPNCTAGNVLVPALWGSVHGNYIKQQVCANFIYDLNGKKGPNTMGKDIGIMSVIYSSDSKVVMPMYPKSLPDTYTQAAASAACHALDEGEYRLPNIEELLSIYYNVNLVGGTPFGSSNHAWSATAIDSGHFYTFGGTWGVKYNMDKNFNYPNAICVKR